VTLKITPEMQRLGNAFYIVLALFLLSMESGTAQLAPINCKTLHSVKNNC
jgi:hypothetical protein